MSNKNILPHFLTFLFFFLISVAMFYATQRQISIVSRNRVILSDLVSNQDKLLSLESLVPRYRLISEKWTKSLPKNEAEVAIFADDIERRARGLGLKFSLNFDDFPGPVDVSGHYISGIGTEITLEGGFSNVASFVDQVSESDYFFKIDKITITKPESKIGVKTVLSGALMMNQKL